MIVFFYCLSSFYIDARIYYSTCVVVGRAQSRLLGMEELRRAL